MEGFFCQIMEGVTEAVRTLGEAFGETDDDPPATSTVDSVECLECDDNQLKAIAEDYNHEGDARLNKNDFGNALDFYTKGIELKCKDDQLNATMYTNRARVHFCLGYFDEALSDVRSAREFQPLHLEAIEWGASTCMEQGLYKEVIKWCDEGLAIDNRSKKWRDLKSTSMKIQAHQDLEIDDDTLLRGIADGHNKDGDEELCENEFDSAIDCYTEGIEVKCKDDRLNAVLYTNRATVHSLMGNYDHALRDAKCARKFQPTFVNAILTGARACFELGFFEEAVTWCNDGLAIDKEGTTMLELRERSLIELCQLRKEEENNASPRSQSNLGLDWRMMMDFPSNYHRGVRRMIGGNEYDTVYFKTDLAIYSMKGLKKGVNVFKRWFNRIAEETVENDSDGQVAGFSCLPGSGDTKLMIRYYELELSANQKIGYKAGEERAYDNLGIALQMSGDFKKAIVCHKEHLNIALELKDRAGQGRAYGNLGSAYCGMNDMEQAVDFFKLNLGISKEVGQRASEGRACRCLGHAHVAQGKFKEAEDYFKQHLVIARELGDRSGEGLACGNLGLVCGYQEEFQRALEYGEQFLSIAKEIGNRDWEGKAYGNLGLAYHNLSDIEQAIDYYKLQLSIVKEMGQKEEEQNVYTCLGDAFCSHRDFRQAAEYHKLSLNIAKELGDRSSEAKAYGSLSDAYKCLNDYKQTVEYGMLNLIISQEEGIKSEEATAYRRLGDAFLVLGDVEQALSYYNQRLHVATEVGDLLGEGCAYGLIGAAYQSLGELEIAVEYHQRHLCIAEGMENMTEQGYAYRNMGVAYQSLEEFKQAIECFEKFLGITKNTQNRENEGIVYGDLGGAYLGLGDFQRAIHYHELSLNIAEEVGSKVEQGNAYYALGTVYEKLDDLPKAFDCFQSSVQLFKDVKAFFQSKDDWKINFQNDCQRSYIGSWRVLVKQEKWIDALLTAEEGRAQALMDLMTSQYGLQGKIPEPDIHENDILDLQPNTLFLALDGNMLNSWLLLGNNEVLYRAEEIET